MGATVISHSLVVEIVDVLGRPWGSLAPSMGRAGSLAITLVIISASVSSGCLIKAVKGIFSLMVSEFEGAGEHHYSGKGQQKFEAHWNRYVIIISSASVFELIILKIHRYLIYNGYAAKK